MNLLKKKFLNSLNSKGDVSKFEKEYKGNLKDAREKYNKLMSKEIEKQKKINKKGKKKEFKREKVGAYKVKPGKFELNLFQKLKYKLDFIFFKIWFKLKIFFKSHMPHSVSYMIIRTRIFSKRFIKTVKRLFEKVSNSVKYFFSKIISISKKVIKKISNFFKLAYGKVASLFGKKPVQEKDKGEKNKNNSAEEKTNSDQNK